MFVESCYNMSSTVDIFLFWEQNQILFCVIIKVFLNLKNVWRLAELLQEIKSTLRGSVIFLKTS